LYPKEWNVIEINEEEQMLANTQIIEQTNDGDEDQDQVQGPYIEIEG
jgi:hypothetical protein